LTFALAHGCDGGGEDTSGTNATGTSTGTAGGGGQGGGGGGSGGEGGSGGGIFTGCASGIVCGSGECCASGQECVLGACLAGCSTNVRCGADLGVCCGAGELCLADKCYAPTGPCLDWADCAENEFCEPTQGTCLPQPPGAPLCEYKPPVEKLDPILEWSWTGSAIFPAHNQVINMPVVVDLEKDGTPDVVIVTSDSFDAADGGYLRALNGKDGTEKWDAAADVYLAQNRVQPRGTPAVADIDGDGFVEIVTPKAGGGLIAFEHNGVFKWASTQLDGVTPWTVALMSATVAIADLEGDGKAEIVVAGAIFEANGKLRYNGGALFGANNATYGAVSIIADLDGAFPQEIVGGKSALRSDGTMYWTTNLVDGYPAIADLDLDGKPELVVISQGAVRVQNPTTGAVLAQLQMPGTGAGGPPTIASFDADPNPEIAAANGSAYSVFEYTSSPAPALSVKWQVPTQDMSSNRTGSSLFDFQGDGVAEVVYNDECYMRVYNGIDGSELYKVENSSATIHEYPVIADVDGDNNTEILVGANDLNHKGAVTCPYGAAGARHGVFLYGDAKDNWVRTRKIWNQHAYHITNINADGSLPSPESPSWLAPAGFNNYRQSNQGAGVFNAPDLQVSLEASLAPCPEKVLLRAFVQNKGSQGAPPGVTVTFYRGDSASGTLIGSAVTTGTLLPGQYEVVTIEYTLVPGDGSMVFYAVADADDMGNGSLNECLEDNNGAKLEGVECTGAN
jgi:hypothetical protein